jgi:hypothetical protein
VEDQDLHESIAAASPPYTPDSSLTLLAIAPAGYGVPPAMNNPRQIYRLRAPASGREALTPLDQGAVYVDRESGEELLPVTRTLPLAPSDSALLRTPENLRICRRCDQLIGLDISDCPYCGLRQPALDGDS